MFAQVITGLVVNQTRLDDQLEDWVINLRPGAEGFLGSTSGVDAEGQFLAVVRFEDENAARVNSDRAEQDAWWKATAPCFDGEVTFRESGDIEILGPGGSDDAGFVQVIQGRTADRAEFMSLERELEPGFIAERADFIGSTLIWWEDQSWVEVAYFTSEVEVRAGESRGLSKDLSELFARWQDIAAPSSYLDFSGPRLTS